MSEEHHDNLVEQLSAYIDGELTDAQRRDVEALLARDAFARQELERLRSMVAAVGALDRRPAPPGLADAVLSEVRNGPAADRPTSPAPGLLRPLLALAAMVVVTVGVGLWSLEYGEIQGPRELATTRGFGDVAGEIPAPAPSRSKTPMESGPPDGRVAQSFDDADEAVVAAEPALPGAVEPAERDVHGRIEHQVPPAAAAPPGPADTDERLARAAFTLDTVWASEAELRRAVAVIGTFGEKREEQRAPAPVATIQRRAIAPVAKEKPVDTVLVVERLQLPADQLPAMLAAIRSVAPHGAETRLYFADADAGRARGEAGLTDVRVSDRLLKSLVGEGKVDRSVVDRLLRQLSDPGQAGQLSARRDMPQSETTTQPQTDTESSAAQQETRSAPARNAPSAVVGHVASGEGDGQREQPTIDVTIILRVSPAAGDGGSADKKNTK